MKTNSEFYLGNSLLPSEKKEIQGNVIKLDGEDFYKISNFNQMSAFFMSIVSSSDHWMFISSTGGLTCGRKNPENALFPYYTDDKIHDSAEHTGPLTLFLVQYGNRTSFWKPFLNDLSVYNLERNIYKSIYGNKVIFEEINYDLDIAFSYAWMNSDKYGFVRHSKIQSLSSQSKTITFIDGLRNILPYGVNRGLQNNMSTLVDGYKQSELIESAGLGIYTLSSILTDRAEPSEALKSTIVWQQGVSNANYLLSEDQLQSFIRNKQPKCEQFKRGQRGSFFINSTVNLQNNTTTEWYIIADLEQGPSDVPGLIEEIKAGKLTEKIIADIHRGTEKLYHLVSQADGIQLSKDKLISSRHFSNTLFNIMRGGTFQNEYTISKEDLIDFIGKWNKNILNKHNALLQSLNEEVKLSNLFEISNQSENPDLIRLTLEYLPIIFSRRHGDPSRPWNIFSIDIKKSDGSENLNFQGNWRDIFQNWEALSLSFPEYIESFIAKFVNASTADGYNPYRVTKDGIDWEILDPDDPWSNIGYWGDHQLIYLLKLLELSHKYHPGKLEEYLNNEIFVYADVPYRIKNYEALIQNPRNTINYDENQAAKIEQRVNLLGSDGKLIHLANEKIYKVNLLEKILVSTLSKLGNFVPGGGIWMNTQRPEWNDANNALVGYGLSMVTLYYLRRYLDFLLKILAGTNSTEFNISSEVRIFFDDIKTILKQNIDILSTGIDDVSRKEILDLLGKVSENYRQSVYAGFSGIKRTISKNELETFLCLSLKYIDNTIKLNKREDGLYHAYNLVHFDYQGYQLEHLHEMLEGQVAVISSGYLKAEESLELLVALKNSKIYRKDQNSYMLYPDRELPRFLNKNNISKEKVEQIDWLNEQIKNNKHQIIEKDINGQYHFNGSYRNSIELRAKLQEDTTITYEEINAVCMLFEEQFKHKQFTGRSGTFYKYEGLGCIYWHMVSKLLLAVQEVWCKALRTSHKEEFLTQLYQFYNDIKEGIGLHKNPADYGAFPIDPYSHTPSFAGVQQPGMTGQVKEDLITRHCELGIFIFEGKIVFKPSLLSKDEFILEETSWKLSKVESDKTEKLPKKSLAFTLCSVPVIYTISKAFQITIKTINNETIHLNSNTLDLEYSQSIFRREGAIKKLIVQIPEEQL